MSSKEEKSLEKFNNYILNYFIFFLIQYLIYSSLALVNIKKTGRETISPPKTQVLPGVFLDYPVTFHKCEKELSIIKGLYPRLLPLLQLFSDEIFS